MYVYNQGICDLTGVQYFDRLTNLSCSGNQLTALPNLPNSLLYLDCGYNSFTTLPNLPNSLLALACDNNNLSSLPSLPSSLTSLYCPYNNLTTLPSLPSLLVNLDCGVNELISLPVLPNSLCSLSCNYNRLPSFPSFPNTLTYLDCSYANRDNMIGNASFPILPNNLRTLRWFSTYICLSNIPDALVVYDRSPQVCCPVPVITTSGTSCGSNGITLTSSEPSGNLWNTGDTSRSITILGSGWYSVSVVNRSCYDTNYNNLGVYIEYIPGPSMDISRSICQGASFAFGSRILTTSGTYVDTLRSINGCDSIVTLTLTVNPSFSSTLARTICGGSSYTFGARVLSTSGTYVDSLRSINGCDSLVTLTLTVSNSSTCLPNLVYIPDSSFRAYLTTNFPAAMHGNYMDTTDAAVTAFGTAIGVSNLGIRDLTGVQYFDGLSYLSCSNNQLTSLPALPSYLYRLNCESNQLTSLPTLPNQLYELYCDSNQLISLPTLPNSLVILTCADNNLTSIPALPSSLENLACVGNMIASLPELPNSLRQLFCYNNLLASLPALPSRLRYLEFNNNNLTVIPSLPNSVQALFWRENPANCLPNIPDSLTYFDITLVLCGACSLSTPVITPSGSTTLCSGSSVSLTSSAIIGNRWNTGDTTQSIAVSSAGSYFVQVISGTCTSLISNVVAVVVNPVSATTISLAICQGSGYLFNGITRTTSGFYYDTLQNATGCDSIVTLNLTVNPNLTSSITRAICQGSSYVFGTQTLTTAGTYSNTVQSASGCDSVISLALTVNPIPVTPLIVQRNDTLFASTISTHYQWYRGDMLLVGDTMIYYKTNYVLGNYKVISGLNSCRSQFSSTFTNTNARISDFIKIYPNPATSHFTIEVTNPTTIQVLNALGQVVISQKVTETTEINTSTLPSGMYTVLAEGFKATSLVVSR